MSKAQKLKGAEMGTDRWIEEREKERERERERERVTLHETRNGETKTNITWERWEKEHYMAHLPSSRERDRTLPWERGESEREGNSQNGNFILGFLFFLPLF